MRSKLPDFSIKL